MSLTGGPPQQRENVKDNLEWKPEKSSLKIHTCIPGKRASTEMQV